MGLITEKELENAVLAAVPLEDSHTAGHIASANRPKNSILADLAVVTTEISRVQHQFSCILLPLNDLSPVIIDEDSTDPETQRRLRYYWVHSKYLQQRVQANQSGNAPNLLLEWYDMRMEELSMAMMDDRRSRTLILDKAPSAW